MQDWRQADHAVAAADTNWGKSLRLSNLATCRGRYEQPIDEVEIEKSWAEKHWRALELGHRHTPFFKALAATVRGGASRQTRRIG
jgi:hypothetical protein